MLVEEHLELDLGRLVDDVLGDSLGLSNTQRIIADRA